MANKRASNVLDARLFAIGSADLHAQPVNGGNAMHRNGMYNCALLKWRGICFSLAQQIGIYLSTAINTALHGEPSAPDKFSGAAFKK